MIGTARFDGNIVQHNEHSNLISHCHAIGGSWFICGVLVGPVPCQPVFEWAWVCGNRRCGIDRGGLDRVNRGLSDLLCGVSLAVLIVDIASELLYNVFIESNNRSFKEMKYIEIGLY